MKKGFILMLLVFVIGLPQNVSASALDQESSEIMSQDEIDALSNDEFDEYINSLITETTNYDQLQEDLSVVGVELSETKTVPLGDARTRMSLGSLSITSARRGQETFYRLIASMSLQPWPGSQKAATADGVAIYFNSKLASFYSTNCGPCTGLSSGINALSGTLVFSYSDMSTASDYCSVYVTPKAGSSGQWLDYGVDWLHTEVNNGQSITGNVGFSFVGGVITGSIGVTFTPLKGEAFWQKAALDAVLLP